MSEQTAAPGTDAEGTDDAASTEETPAAEPKPTETVDFWKSKAREQEKRAKANADAATRLAAIEEANKTEAQKSADQLAAAQRDAEQARAEALRFKIAAKFQVSDEDADLFLTGTDEETLTRQAQRLTDREAERKKGGNHVAREGKNPSAAKANDERATVRELFGNG